MSNRELLELAAKAAGISQILCYETARNCLRIGTRAHYRLWKPLDDDGDAMRLAVKLRITVEQELLEAKASAYVLIGTKRQHFVSVSGKVTRQEATRSAIVRAAAEIGRAMP